MGSVRQYSKETCLRFELLRAGPLRGIDISLDRAIKSLIWLELPKG